MKKKKLLIGILTVSLLMGATAGHAVMAENTEAESMADAEMQESDEAVTAAEGEEGLPENEKPGTETSLQNEAAGQETQSTEEGASPEGEISAGREQSVDGEESTDGEQLTDTEQTSEEGEPESGSQAASEDEMSQEEQTPDGEQSSGQDADEPATGEETQPVTVTVLPTASDITYGQTLAESQLTGGEATVPGTFAWKAPETLPAVADSGLTGYEVIFTPEDTAQYETVTFTLTLTVNKADAIVLVAPAPMTDAVSGSME